MIQDGSIGQLTKQERGSLGKWYTVLCAIPANFFLIEITPNYVFFKDKWKSHRNKESPIVVEAKGEVLCGEKEKD